MLAALIIYPFLYQGGDTGKFRGPYASICLIQASASPEHILGNAALGDASLCLLHYCPIEGIIK